MISRYFAGRSMMKWAAASVLALLPLSGAAHAMGPDPYIGSIGMFAGNFAPRGWMLCEGQTQSIAQNTALFSILGTTYGGNGTTTFQLPDLKGRVPMHPDGQNGLGMQGGSAQVTLTISQMPVHAHPVLVSSDEGTADTPAGGVLARAPNNKQFSAAAPNVGMNAQMCGAAGGGQPFDNRQPFLCVNFCIAMQGVFPSRN